MKLGLGLYRHRLTPSNFRFARQAGATHIVAHLVNYFADDRLPNATEHGAAWGRSDRRDEMWTLEELRDLRAAVETEGLELAAIENLDPVHWYDVLLDGPQKAGQLENLTQLVRHMGEAGIPCLGYNFSLAGVWGHVVGPWARGGAESVGYLGADGPRETPMRTGEVWNMTYADQLGDSTMASVSEEQMWSRLRDFLQTVVPVAEESGVRLAAHPDDPPVPRLRDTPRMLTHPGAFQRLLDIVPSRYNALEFCQGTVSEMAGADVYETIERFSSQDAIAYVHFRNVHGKVPDYREVFIDEGDVDMMRALRIYRDTGYDGVMIPDHTPQMECGASWHAGMAFALGYMRAALTAVERA